MRNFKNALIIGVVSLISVGLYGCGILQNDVSFARTVMSLLIKDRYVVRPMIDWPNLRMLDQNVGEEYSQFKSESERADYERAFISNFAKGFKAQKASLNDFCRWRVHDTSNPKLIVVAADSARNKDVICYFYIKHTGLNKKFVGMEIYVKAQAQE